MVYLNNRSTTTDSVNLVAVGAGGWVRFWSTSGHGLAAEFCIFDQYRRTSFYNTENESVTSCIATLANNLLLTGDSLGYIMVNNCNQWNCFITCAQQAWDISCYCLHKTTEDIIFQAPPLELMFRAHMLPILSISLAENKSLIITSSADQCIRLWTSSGRYLSEFMETCCCLCISINRKSWGSIFTDGSH